jgi:hypothetical protein
MRIFALLLGSSLLLIASQSFSQRDGFKAIFDGETLSGWEGNEIPINLTITEDGDGLGGTWTGPQATNVLSDVSLAGDTLSFSMQTQQGSLKVSFELEGDTLSGGLSTPQGNLPIVGKKSA